jgi:hypothetical protein
MKATTFPESNAASACPPRANPFRTYLACKPQFWGGAAGAALKYLVECGAVDCTPAPSISACYASLK